MHDTRYRDTLQFAHEAFAGRPDKAGLPMILHSVRVAERLYEAGFPVIYQQVGLLHDVLEDTPVTLMQLRAAFGDKIADAVYTLTKQTSYREYIQGIADCGDALVITVKIFDIGDNLLRREPLHASMVKRYTDALTVLRGEVD